MKKITLNKSRKKCRINLDGSFVRMIKPVKLKIVTANYLRLQKKQSFGKMSVTGLHIIEAIEARILDGERDKK